MKRAGRGVRILIRVTVVAVLVPLLEGCARPRAVAPLGGIGVGRAHPLGAERAEATSSFGRLPDVSGTAPALAAHDGEPFNPVLTGDERTRTFLDFGFSVAANERVDVGLSLARGLHALWEIDRRGPVSFSLRPAIYHDGWAEALLLFNPGNDIRSSVWNFNLTGLVDAALFSWEREADDPGEGEARAGSFDLFAGVGANHYRLTIEDDSGGSVHHTAAPLSVVGGASLLAGSQRLAFEATGTWIRQRGHATEFVPAVRVYFSQMVGLSHLSR